MRAGSSRGYERENEACLLSPETLCRGRVCVLVSQVVSERDADRKIRGKEGNEERKQDEMTEETLCTVCILKPDR